VQGFGRVATAVALGAILGLDGLKAQTAPAAAGAATGPAEQLQKFEVTGSRIKRVDYETPAPVEKVTMPEVEAKGYTNIGDFIQSMPFMSGSSNSIFQTASFQRGAATSNIRGLGAQRFLTLVNSRRAVPYALVSPNSGTRQVFDFNSLPAAAVDSIEFLKDGASALYGSDAISGVLNIKLKRNFSGLSLNLYYGNTLQKTGGDTAIKQASFVAGSGAGKTSILTAVDVKTSNSNSLRDYGVTTADYSYLGTNKGFNQNSTANFPASVSLTRAQAATAGVAFPSTVAATVGSWTFLVQGGTPTANPTLGNFAAATANGNSAVIPNENRYNFAETYQIYPAYDYISNFTSVEHEISRNLKAFADVIYSRNSTYYAFTPVPITFSTEGLTLPANNPFNPFGIPLTTLSARATFIPVRKFDVISTSSNMVAGLRGSLLDRWDWETGVSYGFSDVNTVSRNAMRAATLQSALNGTTRTTAFNPFGPSDPAVIRGLTTVSTSNSRAESLNFDVNASGLIFETPVGAVGAAAGLEVRNERLQVNPDTAAYVGSGGGNPLRGDRRVSSQFLELTAPLYKSPRLGSAELQAAVRHEKYSDFGNTTNPKFGVKVRLPDTRWVSLLVRASYSESFQAPPLGLLYASQTVAFSSGVLQDPLRPQDAPVQQRIVQGGNPNLLPEIGKVQFLGGVIELPRVKNLSFSVDFFNIRISQFIVTPSATYLLSERGRNQFPNAIVRDSALGNPGPILRIESVPSNNPAAYQLYRGLDYGVRYALRNTRFGTFQFSGSATQVIKVGTDSGLGSGFFNNAGYYFDPRWKGTATTAWNHRDYGASVTADYIHSWFNDAFTTTGWGENPSAVLGAQLRYMGFWKSTISVGGSNLLNRRPPVNGRDTTGFSSGISGPMTLGRFLYIRVRKDF
jgi:outer membrane receptor protein involved in Fe transport